MYYYKTKIIYVEVCVLVFYCCITILSHPGGWRLKITQIYYLKFSLGKSLDLAALDPLLRVSQTYDQDAGHNVVLIWSSGFSFKLIHIVERIQL